jgi:hypothetical protein
MDEGRFGRISNLTDCWARRRSAPRCPAKSSVSRSKSSRPSLLHVENSFIGSRRSAIPRPPAPHALRPGQPLDQRAPNPGVNHPAPPARSKQTRLASHASTTKCRNRPRLAMACETHPPFQPRKPATSICLAPPALRIVRCSHRQQPLPGDHFLHALKEPLPARGHLFGGEPGMGETDLLRHASRLSCSRTTAWVRCG